MDEVQAKREAVAITKRGKPVAKFVPADKNTDDTSTISWPARAVQQNREKLP
jgi:antitoxin (DNA-binding transcriptional repressor) of toxin-antitoxin stability system